MGTRIDYSAVAHQAIFDNITQGPGSGPLMDASRGWQGMAAELQAVQGLVEQAVRGIGMAQQGAAADAATHGTMGLVPWITDAVTAANQMAARISEQAASFAHTRDSMPPPRAVPDVSFSQDPGAWLADHTLEWLPGIQTEHERAQVAAQQDEQRARDLMNGYQGNSNDNLGTRALFTPAPAVVADVTDPTPAGSGSGAGGWGGHPRSAPAVPGAGTHGGIVAPAATASQLVSSAHPMPAPAVTSPQIADGYPDHGGTPIAGASQLRPAPASASAFGSPPIPIPSSGGASRGGRWLRGGLRFAGGSSGASRGGDFGPRPSVASSEASRRTGYPGHTGHPEHGSTGRGGAPGGRNGAGCGAAPPGVAGGRGGGAGDTERQRPSYLVEHDTNAIVGVLPPVAPAVIGADEDYR